jgi:hypothetical protein
MAKNPNNSGIVLTDDSMGATGDDTLLSPVIETPNVTVSQHTENSTEAMAGEMVALIQENASVLQELIRSNTEEALAQIQMVYADCQRQVEDYYLTQQQQLQESITASIASGNAALLKKLQGEKLTLANLRKK